MQLRNWNWKRNRNLRKSWIMFSSSLIFEMWEILDHWEFESLRFVQFSSNIEQPSISRFHNFGGVPWHLWMADALVSNISLKLTFAKKQGWRAHLAELLTKDYHLSIHIMILSWDLRSPDVVVVCTQLALIF